MEFLLPIAFVVSIFSCDRSRRARERVTRMSTKKLTGLIETDDWMSFVVRFVIEVKDVFHVVDELGILFRRDRLLVGEVQYQGVF